MTKNDGKLVWSSPAFRVTDYGASPGPGLKVEVKDGHNAGRKAWLLDVRREQTLEAIDADYGADPYVASMARDEEIARLVGEHIMPQRPTPGSVFVVPASASPHRPTISHRGMVLSADFPPLGSGVNLPLMSDLFTEYMCRNEGIEAMGLGIDGGALFRLQADVGQDLDVSPEVAFEDCVNEALARAGGLWCAGPDLKPVQSDRDMTIEVCARVLAAAEVPVETLLQQAAGYLEDEEALYGLSLREQIAAMLDQDLTGEDVLKTVEAAAMESLRRLETLPEFNPEDCDIDSRPAPAP